jgi:hypothetical protein
MHAFLLPVLLLGGASAESAPAPRPLTIPAPVHTSNPPAELRWTPDGPTFPVLPGTQVTARICGTMPIPATDPGRTRIEIALVYPLLAKDGRTVLLPSGTQLLGQVHLLHGEFVFVDFQACILPDGRGLGLPDAAFRLGPGPLLASEEGTPALLTVARPLRVEAFRPVVATASARP